MVKLSNDYKVLLTNFLSLSVLRGLSMLLPLITLPYLISVLGVETYGLVSFAVSIVMYFNILISFGFELSATREISMNRDNNLKVSEIFFSVIIIKLVLFIISLIIFSIIIFSIPKFSTYILFYYVTFSLVIGNMLFPTWFFLGIEKMKNITFINAFSRILFTILIFLFVKKQSDFILVPLFNSIGAFLGSFIALIIIFKSQSLVLHMPNKQVIFKQFRDSFKFFISRVANNGSQYYSVTIIGLIFGNKILGYYSLVSKLFYVFMSLGGIISQTIYPYMSRTNNLVFFKKILKSITITALIITIPLMFYNQEILNLVFKLDDKILSNMFLIVFSGSIFGIVNALLGYPLLAAFGHIKYANYSLVAAAIFYLVYITIMGVLLQNLYLTIASVVVYEFLGMSFRLFLSSKVGLIKVTKQSIFRPKI